MSALKFMSSMAYNTLPHIYEVHDVPILFRKDLDDLRALLRKHKLPAVVSIRLIHKHFDTVDDEVMVIRTISVPPQVDIRVMGPMTPQRAPPLRGIHYLVDEEGQLQSYEYTTSSGPDISGYETFLAEFCDIIIERGLQRKWGLGVGVEGDRTDWNEFEVPSKRSTLMIPRSVVLPAYDYQLAVVTDWAAESEHGNYYCEADSSGMHQLIRYDQGQLCFAGKKLEYSSSIYSILSAAIIAM